MKRKITTAVAEDGKVRLKNESAFPCSRDRLCLRFFGIKGVELAQPLATLLIRRTGNVALAVLLSNPYHREFNRVANWFEPAGTKAGQGKERNLMLFVQLWLAGSWEDWTLSEPPSRD